MRSRHGSVRWSLPTGPAALTGALLLLSLSAAARERPEAPPEPSTTLLLERAPQESPTDEPSPQAELPPPGSVSPGPQAPEASRPRSGTGRVDCYTRADALVSLTNVDALRLCDASESDAPVQCYQLARDKGLLDTQQAVLLCQYATNVGPAECFLAAKARTLLTENDIVRLCQPSFFDVWSRPPSPYN